MRAVIHKTKFRRRVLALTALAFLASCEAAGTMAGGGASSDYLVARQALETGNYDLAIRRYARLMDSMDAQTAARLQLEYAHALLRGDRLDEAVATADLLIARQSGSIAASALAVRGTARHEAARARIAEGQRDAQVRGMLQNARADIGRFLEQNAGLDSGGSMRARLQLIDADLQTLG